MRAGEDMDAAGEGLRSALGFNQHVCQRLVQATQQDYQHLPGGHSEVHGIETGAKD